MRVLSTCEAGSPAQMQAKRLRFDYYVLDLDRGCLIRDGNEIALRPKTFAVLHYLIENSGRLVSKDKLRPKAHHTVISHRRTSFQAGLPQALKKMLHRPSGVGHPLLDPRD